MQSSACQLWPSACQLWRICHGRAAAKYPAHDNLNAGVGRRPDRRAARPVPGEPLKPLEIGLPENVKSLHGRVVVCSVLITALLAACSSTPVPRHFGEVVRGGPEGTYLVPAGIHKIKHVIIVMQENRSFDSYFGTFPGADGIPMANGKPAVCVPDPVRGCTPPYHDTADVNGGGPHGEANAVADVNHGQMNGFIKQRDLAHVGCKNFGDPACKLSGAPDVMGYHTAAEIPNYACTWCRDGRPSAVPDRPRAA